MSRPLFLLVFILLLLISRAWSHEYLQTNTFLDVKQKALELSERYGAESVLLVFDIDNTLLKARQPLGSDQWFEWQAEAIKQHNSDALFASLDALIQAHGHIFQLSTMALTEPQLPELVREFKAQGHTISLLTSRGPDMRNATERELLRNNLWFAKSSLMPGIPENIQASLFKNPVSFMNGIFMTAGHHKGEALAWLLKQSQKHFKAIIFVDDHERHTRRVYDSFSPSPEPEIITFRYGKEDAAVAVFKQGSKTTVAQQTKALFDSIRLAFPEVHFPTNKTNL